MVVLKRVIKDTIREITYSLVTVVHNRVMRLQQEFYDHKLGVRVDIKQVKVYHQLVDKVVVEWFMYSVRPHSVMLCRVG